MSEVATAAADSAGPSKVCFRDRRSRGEIVDEPHGADEHEVLTALEEVTRA
jgi:hypothetical protein